MDPLSPDGVAAILAALPSMTAKEQAALLADLDALTATRALEEARTNFLAFCRRVYPNFKEGPHHRNMNKYLKGVLSGEEDRVTISMPPRFGKSETVAYLFVAFYLGHNPGHHIMMVTHTADLSADFGRKVRNLISSDVYREIFPDTVVSADKAAANNWTTTKGGKYLAIGIGANVAGHGAHLLVADDVVSEQSVLSGNPDTAFATAWNYMQVGPIQRLMPGGRIVMIGCMTAETRVLLADGFEKELQHIVVGDEIATYDNGKITVSRVTNWIQHRPDFVYKIRMMSGRIVRANKRHPFLVDRDGARSWVRVRDLKVGDYLVGVVQQRDAIEHTGQKGCALFATSDICTQQAGQEPNAGMGIGGSGEVPFVPLRGVPSPFLQKGSATVAMAKRLGVRGNIASRLRKNVKAILDTGTAFLRKFTTICSQAREGVAQSASSRQQIKTQGPDKYQSSTSITATRKKESEDSCATTAIWPLGMQAQKGYCSKLQDTYGTIPDAIVEIVEDGFEPVFDMEVARTENFIANGVVSHNTRWGKKDPIGRALAWAEQNADSPQWTEIRFPAILPSGKSLWPEQWPIEQLLSKKASMFPQFWAAQYQQEPTSEEGALVKREWWRIWEKEKPPKCDYILQSWDTAHETKSKADPSAVTTWGLFVNENEDDRMQVILLDAWAKRVEFPELKKFCLEYYNEWEPDMVIVEKKAAGAPLIQELRAMGVPVQDFTPSRGNDKRVRMNGVSDMFASGMVWAPERRWAREVIDQVAEFPNAENDDLADTVSQALLRIRQGGFIRLATDEKDDTIEHRRHPAYY